jgi:tetraacyldisaccharide 4'-kinase
MRRYYQAGRQRRLRRPVVSIGNISTGGRGKTPLTGLVARLFVEAGERPAVLSRGYGRRVREDGVVVVSDGTDIRADLDRSGDEPLMLARAVSGSLVLVSEQRALAGALAEHALGATVHLLDDGFQHVTLGRDVDLVLVSAEDLEERLLPFGRLREPLAALAGASALVLDEGDAEAAGRLATRVFERIAPAAPPVFRLVRQLGSPVPLEARSGAMPAGPAVALAGIARPERFFAALAAAGWRVAARLPFADHHRYSRADLVRLAATVRDTGAAVVLTTAKDAVRLRPLRPLRIPVYEVPLVASVEPAAPFRTWLLDRLAEARA